MYECEDCGAFVADETRCHTCGRNLEDSQVCLDCHERSCHARPSRKSDRYHPGNHEEVEDFGAYHYGIESDDE